MKTNQPIPAKVSQDGMNAKPVNPYNKEFCENRQVSCLASNICECKNEDDFESQYPERPLTQPMPPDSEIMVEGEAVWRRWYIGKGWVVFDGVNARLYDAHKAYQPILTNQQSEGEKFYIDELAELNKVIQPTADQSASVETVEQAAENYCDTRNSEPHDDYGAFIAGAQYQQAKDLQQVVELIEAEIDRIKEVSVESTDNTGIVVKNELLDTLTDLLTKIKQQNGED